MIEQGAAIPHQTATTQYLPHDAASMASGDESGTILLDGLGRILSCGEPVERIFGARQIELMGRPISEFIVGLLLEGRSPSYDARYLAHLCNQDGWREFGARNVAGLGFKVELNLSRMVAQSQEIFLLNVRRVEDTSCS